MCGVLAAKSTFSRIPGYCVVVLAEIFFLTLLQEPCIEEHCHDSWFPGTSLLSNLHHVINFVRVRVPETAPEVERKRERERERETPPSTSSESATFGQVRQMLSGYRLAWVLRVGRTGQRRQEGGLKKLMSICRCFDDIALHPQSSRRLTGNWREVEGFGNDFIKWCEMISRVLFWITKYGMVWNRKTALALFCRHSFAIFKNLLLVSCVTQIFGNGNDN